VLLGVDGFQDVVGALDVATRRWVFSRHTKKSIDVKVVVVVVVVVVVLNACLVVTYSKEVRACGEILKCSR
jgi:hypothetical protein